MTKPELGTKRLCAGCNAKFYDLHNSPIVCPACEAVFTVPKPAASRPRRGVEPLPVVAPVAAVVPENEDASVELVKASGETETESGVPLLEEIDED